MKKSLFWTELAIVAASLIFPQFLLSQSLVNVTESISAAKPDPSFTWSDSKSLSSGSVTVGNTYDSVSQSYDIIVYVLDQHGNLEWLETFGRAENMNDYATAVAVDYEDNIYVGATSVSTSDSSGDILIIAFDKYGTLLWGDSLDLGGDDLCSDIEVGLNAEQICIVGSSFDTLNQNYDYFLASFNKESEELEWSTTYDRNGFDDFGLLLNIDGGGNLLVSGGSGSSSSEWEITTLTFLSDGTLNEESVSTSTGAGFDQPNEILRGNDGFIYITGASSKQQVVITCTL